MALFGGLLQVERKSHHAAADIRAFHPWLQLCREQGEGVFPHSRGVKLGCPEVADQPWISFSVNVRVIWEVVTPG